MSFTNIGKFMLWTGGYYERPQVIKRGAWKLYYNISNRSTERRFLEALGLQRDFLAIYRMLALHTWMIVARVRHEGFEGKDFAQHLYDAYMSDLAIRTDSHPDLKYRHSKYLKEMEMMWYGSSMAYDRALLGEEQLADALLRNVYLGNKQKRKDAKHMEQYVRRELACLAVTDYDAVVHGDIMFTNYFNDDPPEERQKRETLPEYLKARIISEERVGGDGEPGESG